jgi:DNA-binding MarR family transcriptional regulator
MSDARQRIEQQLTMLFRRAQRVHLMGSHGDIELDRSAYAILCRLDDEGAQRLGALATVFGLDPSTITRQVQSLERSGLAQRSSDPADRRVSLLALTDSGLQAVQATRQHRRSQLAMLLSDWSQNDVERFASLLEQFNESLDHLNPD